jgi:DNA topoisomerase I
MKLLIIESPGKQKTIQKYLGAEWQVIASLGHIRGLEQSIEFIKNDFEPKYEFIAEKAKAIKQIKEAAAGLTINDIYLGADKDYEGEQIAYSVCLLLKLDPKKAKRVTFTEITEKALKAAIDSPGLIDMNKVNTQKTRAILDMMIGFTMSPLLWRYVAPSLSAGRCQTPALRLVLEREEQIQNFKVSSSWRLSAVFKSSDTPFNAQMEDELEDEESAVNYMEIVNSTPQAQIISKDIRPWTQEPPQPLITSTLQQQASALFGSNPKNTMKIAQRLYEAGHITYMRTDKAVISEDATKEAQKWIKENYGEEFVGEKHPVITDESKKTKKAKKKETKQEKDEVKAQEAHEAIRPTHMDVTELPGTEWTAYDKKVYNLIWQRTIQSVMSPARGELCKVRTQIKDDEDFSWLSQWRRTTFEGWKRAGKVAQIDDAVEADVDESESDDTWTAVTKLEVGTEVTWQNMKAEPKETKALPRFTEATLVRELEKFGIGRPSTFASLIATIQDKVYVETKDIPAKEVKIKEYRTTPSQWPPEEITLKKKVGAEKNKLVPTDLGRSVLSFMLKHFDDLFQYGFTAQMERRLDQVADGSEPWKQVLRDMWASYKDRYEELMSKQQLKQTDGQQNARVKEFSGGLKAVQSKKGPLLLVEGKTKEETQFLGWPQGIAFDALTEEMALKFKEDSIRKKEGQASGEWNGKPIHKKTGKFGEYLQCGEISIPYIAQEEPEKTQERFEKKANGETGILKQFKEYVIRTGQYGPYVMKTSLKKPQFVSLPKGVDITNLTEKDVEALYKTGMESKKKWSDRVKTDKKYSK